MKARLVILTVVAVALAALAPASAHVRVGVPGGEVHTFLFRAPVEPPTNLAVHHTQALIIDFSPGFVVQQCYPTADFDCITTTLQVIWTRKAGSTNFATADVFKVDVLTPAVASLVFDAPATQIYSDGEIVRWNETDQLAPHPAPQIRVITEPDKVQPLVTMGTFSEIVGQTTLDISGTATLTRTATQTLLQVDVSGLEPNLAYPAHLHEGTCADNGPHYKDDPLGPDAPPNELWPSSDPNNPLAGLIADANGHAVGSGATDWVARASARSVFIHAPAAPGTPPGGGHPPGHLLAQVPDPHAVHARIACADLR